MGELFVFPINTHLSINSHQIDIHASLKRENNQTKSSFDIDNALDYYIHNEGDVDDDDINFIIIIVIIIFIINININIIEKKKYMNYFLLAGTCWLSKTKQNLCMGAFSLNVTKEECCRNPSPHVSWTPQTFTSTGDLFYWQELIGGAPDCELCHGQYSECLHQGPPSIIT